MPRGFSADICRHAVGTPLLAIRGATELLMVGEGGALNRAGRELLGTIAEALRELERSVDLLTRLASAEEHASPPSEPVALEASLVSAGFALPRDEAAGATLVRAAPVPLAELLRFLATIVGGDVVLEGGASGDGSVELRLGLARGWPFASDAGEGLLEERLLRRLSTASGGRLLACERERLVLSWPRTIATAPATGANG